MDLDFWKWIAIAIICVVGTLGFTAMVLSVWHKIANKEIELKKLEIEKEIRTLKKEGM
jgi:hypothetical protein